MTHKIYALMQQATVLPKLRLKSIQREMVKMAKEIKTIADLPGVGEQAIKKLVDNVDANQVIDYL
jgi:hypothetical protein